MNPISQTGKSCGLRYVISGGLGRQGYNNVVPLSAAKLCNKPTHLTYSCLMIISASLVQTYGIFENNIAIKGIFTNIIEGITVGGVRINLSL